MSGSTPVNDGASRSSIAANAGSIGIVRSSTPRLAHKRSASVIEPSDE